MKSEIQMPVCKMLRSLTSFIALITSVTVTCGEQPALSQNGSSSSLDRPSELFKIPQPPRVPAFEPPSSAITFSPQPSDKEITLARLFEVSLVPLPTEANREENRALADALIAFHSNNADLAPLVDFVTSHPDGRWTPSILLNLGLIFQSRGEWSKPLPDWEQTWKRTKTLNGALKGIADRALGEMCSMYARLGRFDRLQELFAEVKGRDVRGPGGELVNEARAGLWLMQNKPEEAFRCGPLALSKLYGALLPNRPIPLDLINFKSTNEGTNLAEILSYAQKVGLPCQVAFRTPGSSVLVPCIVNWKVGHFSAITRGVKGNFVSQDLTFGRDCMISQSVLDAEASGYFVVRPGVLPAGWRVVGAVESSRIFGKGNGGSPGGPGPGGCKATTAGGNGNNDPSGAPKASPASGPGGGGQGGVGGGAHGYSCGMTTYSFDAASISLMLDDAPVGYVPPVGPAVIFSATYNHRDTADRSNIGNLGDKWSNNWLSYIQAASTSATVCYGPGNGQITYTGYNSSTNSFAPELMSQDILQIVGVNSYVLNHKDGSEEIYSLADNSTPARVFRTASIDAYGNRITFSYDAYFRMQTVTDAIGQISVLTYGLSLDPTDPNFYHITKVTDPFGRYAVFQYNSYDQLTSITDTLGLVSSYLYGPADFVSSLTTPYGTTTFTGSDTPSTTNSYDRWLVATDPIGASERIEWSINTSSFQDVSSSGNAPVAPAGFSNANLNFRNTFFWSKKAMEVAAGNYNDAVVYHFTHDPSDTTQMSYVLESTKEPLENRVWYAYPNQSSTIYGGSTDQPSEISRILDDGTEQDYSYQYNAADNVSQAIDPAGRTTSFSYGSNLIDVLSVSRANGSGSDLLASFTYNSQHLPLTYTDATGETTTYTYNAYGELVTIKDALAEVTTFVYNSKGYLVSITGPAGGATTTLGYDGFGRVNSITRDDGYQLGMSYDAADRLVMLTYPDGTYTQTIYDKLDPEWARDRLGRWSLSLFDPLRRLVLQRDPLLRETTYQRCPCGALTGIVDPRGNQTAWTIDIQNRIVKKIFPDTSFITYTYENTTSRLKTITDALGQTKTFAFNKDSSVSGISYANAINPTPSVSYTYDPSYARVLSMTDGSGVTSYTYNPITGSLSLGAGQLSAVTGPLPNSTIGFTYDALGRRVNRSINGSANSSSVTYDSLGRVSQLVNLLGTFTPAYVNQTMRLQSLAYPNGQSTRFSYYPNSSGNATGNGDDRLQSVTNLNPSGSNLSTFGYTYDPTGEIQTWSTQDDSSTVQTASFQYDAAQQLTAASMPTAAGSPPKEYAYEYDLGGNRVQEQIDNSIVSYGTNNLNQLANANSGGSMAFTGTMSEPGTISIGGNAGSVDDFGNWSGSASVVTGANSIPLVATDLNGNVTSKTITVNVIGGAQRSLIYDANGNLTNNGAGTTYLWDAENRLVSITGSNGTTAFLYNGLGQRVQESFNGVITKEWVWGEGPEPLEERNGSGSVTKRFFGLLGEQIAGASYYFTVDHLGSVHEMLDANGTIQARYSYDPFGRAVQVLGSMAADFGFAGFLLDTASGLSLSQFREYDPNLGRWLNRDPMGEAAGLNIYDYVLNDPINGIDPLGLCFRATQFIKGAAGLIGGIVSFVGVVGIEVGTVGGGTPGAVYLALQGVAAFTYGVSNLAAAFDTNNAQAKLAQNIPGSVPEAVGLAIGGKPGENLGAMVDGVVDIRNADKVVDVALGYTKIIVGANEASAEGKGANIGGGGGTSGGGCGCN